MLSSKSEDSKGGTSSGQAKNTRRDSIVNRRAGLKTALNIAMRTPKPQSLPSYLVKVLLSLVQARLEAQVCFVALRYYVRWFATWNHVVASLLLLEE